MRDVVDSMKEELKRLEESGITKEMIEPLIDILEDGYISNVTIDPAKYGSITKTLTKKEGDDWVTNTEDLLIPGLNDLAQFGELGIANFVIDA
ncbi:MAG: hypothetical protein HUJ56_04825 [Erysipelotrichaceae bacterium]|nr:hypothetical protein [Erysipelotrichaceae bacterium]